MLLDRKATTSSEGEEIYQTKPTYVHLLHNKLDRLLTDAMLARHRVTIDMLPDLALLEIFDFYVGDTYLKQAWHTLVHVCRKWRDVAFGSPRRLNLRLVCGVTTPARETLDVWPLLPIIISAHSFSTTWDVGNIIAALEHNDRICKILIFDVPSSGTETVLAVLQQPFPALTDLQYVFQFQKENVPVVPASFLGGSAPGLQTLRLRSIPFPGLPKLLSTATHLVDLQLYQIPHSGYFSPEAMVTALSVLTGLEHLTIDFESPQSFPDQNSRRLPPHARNLLPVLTCFTFNGVSEYLEVLTAWIDAPLLDKLEINFFFQLMFDIPQLTQFIERTPKFKAHDEARVEFSEWDVTVKLPRTLNGAFTLGIACDEPDLQLSSVAQVCSSSFPPPLILAVEHLYILSLYWELRWPDDIENNQWLELFHPFTAVRCLYIDSEFTPQIASALQELGERVTEVLPALGTLFLEEPLTLGPVQEAIGQFVSARRLAGHPIAVFSLERECLCGTDDD
jgi:hypothetical protein